MSRLWAFAAAWAALGLALPARAESPTDLEAAASAEVDRVAATHLPGLRLRALELRRSSADVGLELPPTASLHPPPVAVENLFETLVGLVEAERPGIRVIDLLVAHPGGPLEAPEPSAVPAPPPAPPSEQPPPAPASAGPQPDVRPPAELFPFGQALAGRVIAVSPGHGYIYYDSLGRYSTQRANIKWEGCGDCRGIIEDFGTHALATRYLVPLLEGAGARVVLVRERSEDPGVDVVDDGDDRFASSGAYQSGSSPGGHGGDYLASFEAEATATWRLIAPSSGPTWASLWFVSGSNRLDAAALTLELPDGRTTPLTLDQTGHGRRWVPVHRLDLEAGEEVRLRAEMPPGASADRALIADAARLGAGTHSSGHPWWSMGAAPFAEHQSAPSAVLARGDVTTRPIYAEFYGAEAYVSLHSNATGRDRSTASGSVTYRYSCRAVSDHANDPDPSVCDDPAGSDRLQAELHDGLVRRIRRDWDPSWRDRGTKAANFGEMRELSSIPGALVETAFHDNVVKASSELRASDNQALHDPRWRRAAAWGLYEGLTRFLAGPNAPLLAPAPRLLRAERLGPGRVRIAFEGEASARAYRVELAVGGYTFLRGPVVDGSPAVLEGLPASDVVGIRLRALNEAGEGPPSRSLAVRAGARGASLLVVDAFEREDAWVQQEDNRGDTALVHGLALAGSGLELDSAHERGLEGSALELTGYAAVVLALGRESTEHGVLTPALRARLRAYVDGGGALFAAGTEIGWALDERGDDESRAFLEEVLGARYAADDFSDRRVRAATGPLAGSFGATPRPLSGPGEGRAEVRYTDVFTPAPGFEAALTYGEGPEPAAIAGPRTLVVGFAVDHLREAEDRAALLGGWASLVVDGSAPTRDAGAGVDGGGPDAGPPDRGSRDLGATDARAADASAPAADAGARLRPGTPGARPVSGGCGCSVGGEPSTGASGGWSIGLALLLGIAAGREFCALRR